MTTDGKETKTEQEAAGTRAQGLRGAGLQPRGGQRDPPLKAAVSTPGPSLGALQISERTELYSGVHEASGSSRDVQAPARPPASVPQAPTRVEKSPPPLGVQARATPVPAQGRPPARPVSPAAAASAASSSGLSSRSGLGQENAGCPHGGLRALRPGGSGRLSSRGARRAWIEGTRQTPGSTRSCAPTLEMSERSRREEQEDAPEPGARWRRSRARPKRTPGPRLPASRRTHSL